MNSIKVLVTMQLKEKLNFKGKVLKSKNILFKSIFSVLKFTLVVALCYLVLFLCELLNLFSLVNYVPTSVITVVFTIMILLQTVTVTWSLTKSMYYSNDNPILLVLPCKHTYVYLSKLIVFYLYELIRNFSFMIPLFVSYGIICSFPIIYYPWMVFCFIFISMVPVLVGVILSIPVMWFYNFFRNYKRLQITCLVFLIGLVTLGVVEVIDLIPANIDLVSTWRITYWKIQDFLLEFTKNFSIFHSIVTMMAGKMENLKLILFTSNNFLTLSLIVLSIILLFIVGFITVRPLFYAMASKPFEYTKKKYKIKKNKKYGKIYSILRTEFLLTFRNSDRVFTNIGLLISMPILIFFLNKIFSAMDTRLLGNNLTIAFNILIILLISLSSNAYAASAFSRDGKSSYLIKVQPYKEQPLLLSKLVVNTIFMVFSFISTLVVLIEFSNLGIIKSTIIVLACLFIYFAHLFYSAEIDIMNPKIELYTTINENTNNPNETKSTIIAFLSSFLVFGILLFLLMENNGINTYLKIMLIGFVFMIFRLYMLINKIKLYYRENDV